MNKFAYICGIAVLSLGFAACDDELPNPPGQSNPQPEIFESSGLVISQDEMGVTSALDLQKDADAGNPTVLGKVETLDKFPEGYDLVFKYEVSDSEDFATTATFDAEVNGDNIVVSPSVLNTLIYDNFTHDPQEITIYSRIAAYAVQGLSTMRLGGNDALFGSYTYKVQPFAPTIVIDKQGYFLLTRTIGATSWNTTAALPFTQVAEGSAYDNPVFMIKFDVPAGGLEWAVLPYTNREEGNTNVVYGVSDAEALSGELIAADGATAAAGVITEESPYSITVNMETLTYSVAFAYDNLYVVSNGNTDFTRARHLETTDFLTYYGVARLQNKWYLTGQASLDGAVFKADGEETVTETGVITGKIVMTSVDPEAVDMAAADGLYYINVNLGLLSYKATRINTISLVGEFNGWDVETAPEFTPSSTSLVWNLRDIDLTAGELKFCCNHGWDINFGATEQNVSTLEGDLREHGENITLLESGKYDVKVNFNNIPPVFTFTKK